MNEAWSEGCVSVRTHLWVLIDSMLYEAQHRLTDILTTNKVNRQCAMMSYRIHSNSLNKLHIIDV